MRTINADDVLSIVDDLRDRMTVEGYCAMVERVKALPSAQPDVPDTNVGDTISRQATIDAFKKACTIDEVDRNGIKHGEIRTALTFEGIMKVLNNLPFAQPEITYQNCSDALLKMWMDNVLTDGEYNRIMDKLNKFDTERRTDG